MKKTKMILIILSLLLMIVPFFINVYSIYKLLSVCIGIILFDISFIFNKKANIFLLFYLPILLIIFTYSIDYIKLYTLDLKPIFVFENKINENVSIYNSLLYRVYKCGNDNYFDNNYKKNFMCDAKLIDEISINKLLNEPKDSYKTYKGSFIKVVGKISKINGVSSIELQSYTLVEGKYNGYVKFNETSKLVINLNKVDTSKYKIYDYITVVGLVDSYDKKKDTIYLKDTSLEEIELYKDYDIQVIESNNCDNSKKEYIDNYYLQCIENIYLDYKLDKYELSYALKDKKITIEKFLEKSNLEKKDDYVIYEFEKFNILSCSKDNNIIMNKNIKIDYKICEE